MTALKSGYLPDAMLDYLRTTGIREAPVLARLRQETASMAEAVMQITPEQGAFMAFVVRLLGARKILEIGVFTGYSSLSMALAMPDDGRLVALDSSEEWTAVARRYWAEAGLTDKIDLRLGAALASLDDLLQDGAAGSFDLAFIDADKANYPQYYERCLVLVRPGGVVAIDNAFYAGAVFDPAQRTGNALTIHQLNERARDDERVDISLLTVGDGLMLCRKRG